MRLGETFAARFRAQGERAMNSARALFGFELFVRGRHFVMRIHRGVTTTVGITLSAKLFVRNNIVIVVDHDAVVFLQMLQS